MGWSPQYYIPSFVEIGPPVPEIFEGFYHIWAWRPSWSCDQHHVIRFSFHCTLKLSIKNLVQIGTVASEKIRFELLYVHELGPRSRNYLDLQYSLTFINSLRCLLLPTFRSLVAIVSEKSTVFTFSYRKASVSKFDLAVKKVKVTPGSSFEQTMMGWSPRCFIPSFVKIGPTVLEKKIFEGFLPYMNVAAILVT